MSIRQWRRVLRVVKQAMIVLAAVALVVWFALSVRAGLARNGINFDMGFLGEVAGFDISEGFVISGDGLRHFSSSDSNAQALFVGFVNTIKVAVVAIVMATVLGTLLGVSRLSKNWATRQLSFGLVEFVRNTPMLIQLVFWYFAVVLKLPLLSDASVWLGSVIFSRNGIYLPTLSATPGVGYASIWALLVGIIFTFQGFATKRWRAGSLAIGLTGLVAVAVLGVPFQVSAAQVDGLTVTGGMTVSPEFAALLLGLTIYTSCFIAEIVRGAILSLHRGQWEAASALGLGPWATYKDVVIPQVFRVVLPACANQYISLTKTTSLGIAIGFPDLFNVYGTVANQSGRSLEGVIVVMLAYLLLSWVISASVNAINKKMLAAGGANV